MKPVKDLRMIAHRLPTVPGSPILHGEAVCIEQEAMMKLLGQGLYAKCEDYLHTTEER